MTKPHPGGVALITNPTTGKLHWVIVVQLNTRDYDPNDRWFTYIDQLNQTRPLPRHNYHTSPPHLYYPPPPP